MKGLPIRIINVWGPKETQVTGADTVYQKCWEAMSLFAKVVVMKSDPKGVGVETKPIPNYLEISIPYAKPSTSLILKKLSMKIFHHRDIQILANLDALSFAVVAFWRFRRQVLECDYVHSYNFWFVTIVTLFPKIRRKVVYTELGGDWKFVAEGNVDWLTWFRYAFLGRVVLNRCKVIAQSPLHASYLVSAGVKRDAIRIVLHGRVDPNVFHPVAPKSTTGFNVLYVGRFIPQKGVGFLIEAADYIVHTIGRKDIRFTFVGPTGGFSSAQQKSTYFESLLEKVSEKKLVTFVQFKSFVEIKNLVELYSSANLYVLPSLQDAFPFTVVESMMCGTPVLGTSSGGMIEQISDGQTGFIVPPGDAHALADKILYLYDHRDELSRMGERAREYALSRFGPDSFPSDVFNAIVSD